MRNRDKFLCSVALFLSMLIVTLPFYTVSAYASIQAKVSGLDGITGYTKDDSKTDDTVYRVVVDPVPANATVALNEIYALPNLYFSDPKFCDKGASCTEYNPVPGITKYNCTCIEDWTPTGASQTFTFAYKTQRSAPIIVRQDYKPPVITSFQLTNVQNAIEATYSITDYACDYSGCTCTGVAGVEIADEKGNAQTQSLAYKPSKCTEAGKFRFNYTGGDGSHSFTLRAFDRFWKDAADNQKHASANATKSLLVDTTPPQISGLSVKKGGLPLSFISPRGVDGVDLVSQVTELNGLKSVSFNLAEFGGGTSNANCVKANNAASNAYNCTLKGANLRLSPGQTSGKVEITALDSFDNRAATNETLTFQIDTTPPQVSGFAVTKAGLPVGYVSSTGINGVDFLVQATDPSGVKSVSFNIAAFGGGTSNANCALAGSTTYNCTLAGANIRLSSGQTSGKVGITAVDSFDNKGTTNETLSFQVDSTGPVFSALAAMPSAAAGGKTYIGAKVNVTATISESESGIAKQDILLNFQGGTIPASNCTSGWVCQWYNLNIPSMAEGSSVSMSVTGKDLVGNALTGTKQEKFYADTVAPVYVSSSITPIQTGIQLNDNTIIKKGDVLQIEYNYTDGGSGVASFVGDLSQLLGASYANTTGSCTAGEGINYTCTITTPAIHPTVSKPKIKLTATDAVGNSVIKEQEIEVYGVSATAVNCFNLEITKSYILPIEVNTLKYFVGNYYEVVPFKLKWSGECNADTVIYNPTLVGSCSGGSKVNVAAVKGGTDISGFFQFAIAPASINPAWGSIEIGGNTTTCALHYFDVVQKTVYTEPEIEDVDFMIPLANDLIPPNTNLEDLIEQIRLDVSGTWDKVIKTIYDIMEMARTICRLKEVLAAIDTALTAIRTVFAGCSAAPPASVVCIPLAELIAAVQSVFHYVKGLLDWGPLNTLCNFVTCSDDQKNSMGILGGGWCNTLRDSIQQYTSVIFPSNVTNPYRRYLQQMPSSNIELAKKSMLFSLICFCIPGVVYNLERARQLDCVKGICYRDMIKVGVPISECDKQYSYNKCVYQSGWMSSLMGLIGIQNLFNVVLSVIKDPLTYVWQLTKWGAFKLCHVKPAWLSTASCIVGTTMDGIEAVLTIAAYVKAIASGDFFKDREIDYCKVFLEPYSSTTTTAASSATTTT